MAHLIEYIGYAQKEDEDGNPVAPRFVIAKSTSRSEVAEKCEVFEQILDYQVEAHIEAKIIRVDVKQIVINLMGSSMGDLELVDIWAAKQRGGDKKRHHVLRRKAYEECPAGSPLAVSYTHLTLPTSDLV